MTKKFAVYLAITAVTGLLLYILAHQWVVNVPELIREQGEAERVEARQIFPSRANQPDQNESAPAQPPAFRQSSENRSRQWTILETLHESRTTVEEHPGYELRRRIVRTKEIDEALTIEELVSAEDDQDHGQILSTHVSNRLLVSSTLPIDKLIDQVGLSKEWSSLGPLGNSGYYLIKTEVYNLETLTETAARFSRADKDSLIEREVIYYAASTPNDPELVAGNQWSLRNTDNGLDINAEAGWTIRSRAPNTIIAIIDSGINGEHRDLKPNLWINRNEIPGNQKDDDGNGYVDDVHGANVIDPQRPPVDDSGHGTHIAGIAGAVGDNGVGISGVCWEVDLLSVKFLNANGRGYLSDAVKAIEYAKEAGADIINASWGGYDESPALRQSIEQAGQSGAVFVASAGNDGYDINFSFPYPASYDIDSLISVASIDKNGNLSHFSNYGTRSVNLAAPGEDILSTWIGSDEAYLSESGTSMAAPHVSGILALLHAQFPLDSPAVQIRRLELSGKPVGALEGRARYAKIPDLEAALKMSIVPIVPDLSTSIARELYHDIGDTVTLSIEDRNEQIVDTSYQWYLDGRQLSGSTSKSLKITTTEDAAGTYKIVATNQYGTDSISFAINVFSPAPLLSEALDNPAGTVLAYTNHDWNIEDAEDNFGGSAILRSVGPNDTWASLGLEVNGPGQLRFRSRHFIAHENAYLSVEYDGRKTREGIRDYWQKHIIRIEDEDPQTIRWYLDERIVSRLGNGAKVALDALQFFEEGKIPPLISRYMGWQSYREGDTAVLRFDVLYDVTSFRWLKNGTEIAQTADPVYVIENVTTEARGEYVLVASNQFGDDYSIPISLDITEGPPRFNYPQSQTFSEEANEGERVVFAPEYEGPDNLSFQWFFGGAPLEEGLQPQLELDPVTPFDSGGYYYLEIRDPDSGETARSPYYWLTVHPEGARPSIRTGAFPLMYVEPGNETAFDVEVQGSRPLTLHWYRDNQELVGRNEKELRIQNATPGDAGTYYVVARNEFGTARKEVTVLFVGSNDVDTKAALDTESEWEIVYVPVARLEHGEELKNGSALRMETASPWTSTYFTMKTSHQGAGTLDLSLYVAPATYPSQWNEDTLSVNIDGINYLKDLNKDGWHHLSYPIIGEGVHNLSLQLHREDADYFLLDNVNIDSQPRFFEQPHDAVVSVGKAVSLNPIITGDLSSVSYQWFLNDDAIPGATGPVYTLDSAAEEDDGIYQLVISEGELKISSEKARLRVRQDLAAFLGIPGVDISSGGSFSWTLDEQSRTLSTGTSVNFFSNWIQFKLVGPTYFNVSTYGSGNGRASLRLDGERHNTIYPDQITDLSIPIPAGKHTVEIKFDGNFGSESSLFLNELQLSELPSFSVNPQSINITYESGDKRLYATIGTLEEVSFLWYRNGEPFQPSDTYWDQSGRSAVLFLGKDGTAEVGSYFCEATLADGTKIQSKTAEVILIDDMLSSVGIDSSEIWIQSDYSVDWKLDYDTFHSGESSLLIDQNSSFSIRTVGSGTVSFWAKAEGLSRIDTLQINSNTSYESTLSEGFDWKRFEIPIESEEGVSGIHLWARLLREGVGKLWIDDVTFNQAPAFLKKIGSIETQAGSSVRFEVQTLSNTEVSYQWFKDDTPIVGAQDEYLEIVSVTLADVGTYRVVSSNQAGETASDPAVLSLRSSVNKALEIPYLQITNGGNSPWTIDTENWLYNGSAIISGPVEYGETSYISFSVSGPTEIGLFAREQNSNFGTHATVYVDGEATDYIDPHDQAWTFYTFRIDKEGAANVRIEVGNTFMGNFGDNNLRRMFIDRLIIGRSSFNPYSRWITEEGNKHDLSESSLEELDPFGDLDKNGILNIWEFLIEEDTPVNSSGMPVWVRIDSHEGFRLWSQATVRSDPNYSFVLEQSEDLRIWNPVDPSIANDPELIGGSTTRLEWLVNPSDNGSSFYRWKAVAPEQNGGR